MQARHVAPSAPGKKPGSAPFLMAFFKKKAPDGALFALRHPFLACAPWKPPYRNPHRDGPACMLLTFYKSCYELFCLLVADFFGNGEEFALSWWWHGVWIAKLLNNWKRRLHHDLCNEYVWIFYHVCISFAPDGPTSYPRITWFIDVLFSADIKLCN